MRIGGFDQMVSKVVAGSTVLGQRGLHVAKAQRTRVVASQADAALVDVHRIDGGLGRCKGQAERDRSPTTADVKQVSGR